MKTLRIVKDDPYLQPYAEAIDGRHRHAIDKERELTGGTGRLSEFADGYLYFGLHGTPQGGWVLREWAPNATAIYLIGTFNGWREHEGYSLKPQAVGGCRRGLHRLLSPLRHRQPVPEPPCRPC